LATSAEKNGSLDTALARTRSLLERSPTLAEEQTREILRVVPLHPEALTLRGRALAALGRAPEAIAVLRAATARDPDSAEAWRTLGDQLILTGDGAGADAAYAQQIRCSVNVPELRKAAIALCNNELAIAERILKPYLKQFPTDVAAIRMLAELAGRLRRYTDAENLLNRAIELAPSFAPARFNLATVLYRTGRTPRAVEELERLIEQDPHNIASRNLLAAALGRIGDVADAVRHYEHVLARLPDATKIWLSYGHSLKTVGRQADSVAAYRRCLALEPGYGEAWWSLANLKTVKLGAEDIAAMTRALGDTRLSAEDRYHLHFALGKAHEDAGDAAAAFDHYDQGNRLRQAEIDYDPAVVTGIVDRSIATFTPALLASRAGRGSPAPDPIFVLGMPRSGSTLIEQILASHPLIEGTQELPEIQRLAQRLGAEAKPSRYPTQLSEGEGARLRDWARTISSAPGSSARPTGPSSSTRCPTTGRMSG
jgi:tetratricopeptide (TPR) repeat protein